MHSRLTLMLVAECNNKLCFVGFIKKSVCPNFVIRPAQHDSALSNDRPIASSPQCEIWFVLFQFTMSSRFLTNI